MARTWNPKGAGSAPFVLCGLLRTLGAGALAG